MKQIIFIFCMILMLSFCGCTNVGSNRNEYMSNWFKSEQEISDNMMKQIIDLYNEGNVKEFEKLFSQNSKKDIEDMKKRMLHIIRLMEIYKNILVIVHHLVKIIMEINELN